MKQKDSYLTFIFGLLLIISSCSLETTDYTTYNDDSEQASSSEIEYESSYCSEGCLEDWIDNEFCDTSCNVENCNYDGSDCTEEENKSTNTIDIYLEVVELEEEKYFVTSIIDGDTIELSTGERVRLICIDTPEINEDGYEEAKNYLTEQILNKDNTTIHRI